MCGVDVLSQVRTSTGTFFDNGHDDVVSTIEERVAQVTMIPKGEQGQQQHQQPPKHWQTKLGSRSRAATAQVACNVQLLRVLSSVAHSFASRRTAAAG
jgi:hypothetical protein